MLIRRFLLHSSPCFSIVRVLKKKLEKGLPVRIFSNLCWDSVSFGADGYLLLRLLFSNTGRQHLWSSSRFACTLWRNSKKSWKNQLLHYGASKRTDRCLLFNLWIWWQGRHVKLWCHLWNTCQRQHWLWIFWVGVSISITIKIFRFVGFYVLKWNHVEWMRSQIHSMLMKMQHIFE